MRNFPADRRSFHMYKQHDRRRSLRGGRPYCRLAPARPYSRSRNDDARHRTSETRSLDSDTGPLPQIRSDTTGSTHQIGGCGKQHVQILLGGLTYDSPFNIVSADKTVQLAFVESGGLVTGTEKIESRKCIFERGKASIDGLVQIDQTALDHKKDQGRLRRIVPDDKCVGLARRLVYEGPRLSRPVVFQISPVTAKCVTMNTAHM